MFYNIFFVFFIHLFDPPGECPDQSEASKHNVGHLLAPGVLQQLGQLQQRVRAVVQDQHHRADADEVTRPREGCKIFLDFI